ncbi:MAG: FitA-like ribbon-helix-helix domain-containing protein, partial [Dermatophilaceae bacterium]
ITIRNIPDATRDLLAARAKASGRSMQEYLSAELTALAERPTPDEALRRIRHRVRSGGYPTVTMEEIVADRDAGRR